MRVLVVEDNQDLAGNLIDYLTLHNCTVDYADIEKRRERRAINKHPVEKT